MLSDSKKWQQCKQRHHKRDHQWRLEQCLFLIFIDNLAVVLGFLTLQYKHNMCTLSESTKFICICCKTRQKSSPQALFLNLVQINFVFSYNIRILSIKHDFYMKLILFIISGPWRGVRTNLLLLYVIKFC